MKTLRQQAFQPIENYGLIGNLCTAALVGMDSSIDFLCFPEFDSPTVFAALLDPNRGGAFSIGPQISVVLARSRTLNILKAWRPGPRAARMLTMGSKRWR